MPDDFDDYTKLTANLSGEGAIAQGEGATALGSRAVLIGEGAQVLAPIITGDNCIIIADTPAKTSAPSASSLSVWLNWIATQPPLSQTETPPAEDLRVMAELVNRAGELLSAEADPSGDVMRDTRLLIATGLVNWRLPASLPDSPHVETKILHSLAVAAIWPLVVAKELPDGSIKALLEISSSEFVTLVTSARAVLPSKNLPGAAIMLSQNIRDPKYQQGLHNLLDDMRDPARGWRCIEAVCAMRDKQIPNTPENAEKFIRWLLIGAAAGAGAGIAYALAERIFEAFEKKDWNDPQIGSLTQQRVEPKNARQLERSKIRLKLPYGNSDMEFMRVKAGNFLMGSNKAKDPDAWDDELPQHTVYLDEYYMGKYPVTNAQYAIFAKANRQKFKIPTGKEQHPVVEVSWDDANAFCAWLNAAQNTYKVALPTEAQWEKAARGIDGWIYPWGNTPKPNGYLCNFRYNEGGTTEVGKYSPQGDSPYGCADMAGNVWEWCADYYDANIYAVRKNIIDRNPTGPNQGSRHVLRGGAWFYDRSYARCAVHYWGFPDLHYNHVGFRILVALVQPL